MTPGPLMRWDRVLALDHLTLLDVAPPDFVALAAGAGFDAVGLRIAPATAGESPWPMSPGSRMLAQTVQRCHDRFRACFDRLDDRDGSGLARRLAEFRDVSSGHEGAAGARDHHGRDAGVAGRPRYQVEESHPDLVLHGIDWRIVDGDDGNVAVSSHAHEFGHARRSHVLSRVPNLAVRPGNANSHFGAVGAASAPLKTEEKSRDCG